MISVIICSADRSRFENVAAMYRRALGALPFEVIGIHQPQGLADGYNRGLARSRGDLVLFSHDDVQILSPDFGPRLVGHLNRWDVIGIAGATKLCTGQWIMSGPPYVYGQVASPNVEQQCLDVVIWNNAARSVGGIKALDGVLLGARRTVFESVRFDAATFGGFHLYDIDFSFRAYLAGFKLAVCCDLQILHDSRGNFEGNFERDEQLFLERNAGRLDQFRQRIFRITTIQVPDANQALEVMTPPHWPA